MVFPMSEEEAKELFAKGGVLFDQEKYEDAIEFFKKSADLSENNESPWLILGLSYRKIGKLEDAAKSYQKVIEINPRNQNAHFILGGIFSELNQDEKAITYLEKAVELNPKDADAWFGLGVAQLSIDQKEAIGSLKKATELDPNYKEKVQDLL